MRHNNTEFNPILNGLTTTLLTVLLTSAILVGVWYAFQRPAPPDTPPVASAAWPTALATFTPVVVSTATALPQPTVAPAPTAKPAPTPITINQQRIAELATMSITLSTAQETQGEDAKVLGIPTAWLNGRDSVVVEYVAKVKLGIDSNAIKYEPDGTEVKVSLPPVEVLGIEPVWAKSRIIASEQRFIGSNSIGSETEAWKKADGQIRAHVLNDSELLNTARQFTRLQIEEQLRKLGFTTVIVQFTK